MKTNWYENEKPEKKVMTSRELWKVLENQYGCLDTFPSPLQTSLENVLYDRRAEIYDDEGNFYLKATRIGQTQKWSVRLLEGISF